MWADHDPSLRKQRRVARNGFGRECVKAGAVQVPGPHGGEECALVEQSASARVHDDRSPRQEGEFARADDAPRGVGQGQVEADNVGATQDVLELAHRANEAVSISVLDGLDICFVARDPKRRMFSSHLTVGDVLPAHCSAAGKVLLASLDGHRLETLLESSGELRRRTPHTITDPALLADELRQVRIRGWAAAEDEMELGTISLAVPIFDSANGVVAALAMASHEMRRTIEELRKEFLPLLLNTAERVGQRVR